MKTYNEYIMEAKETSDESFPDWKKGAILHIQIHEVLKYNRFFIITKRKGNIIYYKEIGKKISSWQGRNSGYEIPDTKVVSPKEYHDEIKVSNANPYWPNDPYITIDSKYHAWLWDGKPCSFDNHVSD